MERREEATWGRVGRSDRQPPRPAISRAGPPIHDHLGQDPARVASGRPALEAPRSWFEARSESSSIGEAVGVF
eukprot:4263492-Alexandrium_andersonii.AAC.1